MRAAGHKSIAPGGLAVRRSNSKKNIGHAGRMMCSLRPFGAWVWDDYYRTCIRFGGALTPSTQTSWQGSDHAGTEEQRRLRIFDAKQLDGGKRGLSAAERCPALRGSEVAAAALLNFLVSACRMAWSWKLWAGDPSRQLRSRCAGADQAKHDAAPVASGKQPLE